MDDFWTSGHLSHNPRVLRISTLIQKSRWVLCTKDSHASFVQAKRPRHEPPPGGSPRDVPPDFDFDAWAEEARRNRGFGFQAGSAEPEPEPEQAPPAPDLVEAGRWMRACLDDVRALNRLHDAGDYSWACFAAHQVGAVHTFAAFVRVHTAPVSLGHTLKSGRSQTFGWFSVAESHRFHQTRGKTFLPHHRSLGRLILVSLPIDML